MATAVSLTSSGTRCEDPDSQNRERSAQVLSFNFTESSLKINNTKCDVHLKNVKEVDQRTNAKGTERTDIMSLHATLGHVLSSLLLPCHVTSRHVASYLLVSRHVMSCHVMSCHVMSCHVMSCHVMSFACLSRRPNAPDCCKYYQRDNV